MPAIAVEALTKSFGQVHAVNGVSFEVAPGECVSLLGPNGAGKTTTTEILEGYTKPDGGRVEVLGIDPQHGDLAWKARLGIVLQSVRDLGDLTVIEAVRHFAKYYPDPKDPEAVIESVGLTSKAGSRNAKLSGGQRRRLDVALGVIGNPELLFLDEPTTGFDPEARREFWVLIETLKAEGATILLTTHYLDEAERLADRVAVIAQGRIIACDAPHSLGNRNSALAIVTWTEHGTRQEIETAEPTRVAQELAARFAGEVPDLAIRRPSLEDTYLALIEGDLAQGGLL
ncbi:MAG: ABC transporter ATP-binding protein [Candidatus Nanopelagicales bacterium]|nr:ABC transporter ATP-binding protein [Candidatus Nanopelagicales bacterium]